MGTFSIWHWLIVLLIVVMIFGTKKLKNIGSDLGGAVKGFKDGMKDGAAEAEVDGEVALRRQPRSQRQPRDEAAEPLLRLARRIRLQQLVHIGSELSAESRRPESGVAEERRRARLSS